MPITYRIDPDRNLIFETWTGKVRAADLREYWKGYLADPEVMKIRSTIVDLRAAAIDFTGKELWSLVQTIVTPALNGREWTTALVVLGGSVAFGVSRQYQVFAESYSKDNIFETVADAERWITSKASSATKPAASE